jgi:cytochrome c biogenesis protein ResB
MMIEFLKAKKSMGSDFGFLFHHFGITVIFFGFSLRNEAHQENVLLLIIL